MARPRAVRLAQAWIGLHSDDPEAVSAREVVRAQLPVGRALRSLRRMRLFELAGKLPARDEIEARLHRSIQFYNPHKESCVVRGQASDPAPLESGERAVLVWERGGERRASAERWWLHETGVAIEVREGVAWLVGLESGIDQEAALEDLVLVRDPHHGLLCNLHAQEYRIAGATVPLPWIEQPAAEKAEDKRLRGPR